MLPSNATLLVVDVQLGFDRADWGPRNNPDAEANIALLIAAWRREGRPIRHIHHASPSIDGAFRLDQVGHQPKQEGMPLPGEPVHIKHVNSGFIGTTLEPDLRADGVDTVVVIGFTTNHCISTTVRMASNLGFRTIVVEDATAAFDRAGLSGDVRLAADVHLGALSDLAEEFATIMKTSDLLEHPASVVG